MSDGLKEFIEKNGPIVNEEYVNKRSSVVYFPTDELRKVIEQHPISDTTKELLIGLGKFHGNAFLFSDNWVNYILEFSVKLKKLGE